MNHLFRDLAPLADEAWDQVDSEARTRLVTYLQGRQLVDFVGPLGWQHSAVNLGRVEPVTEVPDGPVEASRRVVLPLVELRVPFTLSRTALDGAARGDRGIDLDSLDEAARTIAISENRAVFHQWSGGGIEGITACSSHDPVVVPGAEWRDYPRSVAVGVQRLALAGVSGPYGLALGSEAWVGVAESTEQGSTLFEHLGKILGGGPIVWTPGVEGGVVISQRGGDFELVSGQDLSVGFRTAGPESVTLYLEESFTFSALDPTAGIWLRPSS